MTGFQYINRGTNQLVSQPGAITRACQFEIGAIALLSIPLLSSAAYASPTLEIRYNTSSFDNLELVDGNVAVLIDYATPESVNYSDSNLVYELQYNGQSIEQVETFTAVFAQFQIDDLDSDGTAEIIVKTYSGGAHCCTNTVIHTWNPEMEAYTALATGPLDGNGPDFQDLDGDGYTELIGYDNAFLYQFDAYAFSYPPHVILSYNGGELVETTRNHPELLQTRLEAMEAAFERNQAEDFSSNGLLAGYVAESILIGRYESAWQFMLDNYDPNATWGLDMINRDGQTVGQHPDFPTALQSFLIETGYLNAEGQPTRAEQ